MADDRLHVLGIRHHGPGSVASVLDALAAIEPASVLIEGPTDAEEILHFALAPGMRPPLALLIHAAADPAQAVFYPFAEYSPEWQALRFALERQLTVRFIDLPAANQLAKPDEPETTEAMAADREETASPLMRDPLGTLAAAAGESDGETWWNALVEQGSHSRDVFPAIAQAMSAVREAFEAEQGLPSRERIREEREAHMRLRIRDALREADCPVAVICGAWHVPALLSTVPASEDRERLKGLARVKTSATWVPWTDPVTLYNVACYYALLSDVDRAMEVLERWRPHANPKAKDWIRIDSDFDPLRSDSRFQEFLHRL